jgi:catechol 2,3-dioxygenase-like lactoylglutathione lyase family enzyme
MAFELSPNIAIYVSDLEKAKTFYLETLGFLEIPGVGPEIELKSGPNTLFLMEEESFLGAIHELFVDSVESARDTLVMQGGEVVRWRGRGQDCYIKDPFGVIFNLWEK